MAESSFFRTSFESESFHGCQTLLKPERQQFYLNFALNQDEVIQRKHLSQLDLKSQHCLVTRCLPITSILVIIERNSRNSFKRYYLTNWKLFLLVSFHFYNLRIILRFVKKKDQVHSVNIWQLIESKKCAYFNAQKLLLEQPSRMNVFMGAKHC